MNMVVFSALMFLLTWLLNPDPVSRATISDVERNAWVRQPVNPQHYRWDQVLANTGIYGFCLLIQVPMDFVTEKKKNKENNGNP